MPYRVLIVDDQKGVSRLLRSALETIEQNLIVSEAPSGEEAILEARRTRIDLLIADYRLPGINGVELLKKYRLINPAGKVIMVSGISDPRLLKQVSEAAPEAFFAKPVPMGDFLEAVEACLGLTPTILHPTEASATVAPVLQERLGLGELLINLRKNLSAQAVVLLNDMGQVVAEAGQMPGSDNSPALVTALMGLLNSAQKTASLIDHSESRLHLFGGENLDGIFLPVGPTHAILLVGKGLADARALPARLDLLQTVRLELLDALSRLLSGTASAPETTVDALQPDSATPKQVSAVDEPYTRAEDLPGDFLNIFNQIGKKTDDANSFWDSAIENGTTFTEPDKLTYEQASRLGLTPDSAQEK
jgi:DNA-binding NarL/FixJ family response regulator